MIAERQNREKNVSRRRKKEKIIKVLAKSELNNQNEEEEDDDDKDEESEDDTNVKESMNAISETNEALTVIFNGYAYF